MTKLLRERATVVGFLLCLIACGGHHPNGFTSPNGDPGSDPLGDPNGTLADGGADSNVSPACAKATATPEPVPVSLVVMFDKSGSMAQDSKWTSCTQGLSAFFGDAATKGLSASLQFFPQLPLQVECSVSSYSTPAVSMRALPDSNSFASALMVNKPGYGTPTLPALAGAIQYAQAQPGKRAVVLVTDGEPNDCNSGIFVVANEAATGYAAGIPTFVIGVGNAVSNLDLIAQSGGTQQATMVSTNNPQQTEQDFQKALNTIRGLALACEYSMPALPQGATIDQVNVVYTPGNGAPVTLTYDPSCAGPNEWHYDDPKSPKKIILCPSTCQSIQSDANAKIDIVIGCATQGGVH